MSQNRVRPGVPEGGQFAATRHVDADPAVRLEDPNPLVASGQAERVYAAELQPGDFLTASGGTVRSVERLGDEHVVVVDTADGRIVRRADQTLLVTPPADGKQPATPYVLVSGGMVENNPTLPVLDLDLMDQRESDDDTYRAVDELRATAQALGLHEFRDRAQKWLDENDGLRPDDFTQAPDPDIEPATGEGDGYVVFEHGSVANAPALPVIDLEFWTDAPSSDDLAAAYRAIDTANQVGLYDLANEIDESAAAYSDDDGYLAGDD